MGDVWLNKQVILCPLAGSLTRQITFLLNNYKYNSEGEDKTNTGLLIPRYIATGRTAPNGTIYSPVLRKNEDDLVPVRSIITKKDGNLTEITPDLLSKNFLKTSIPEGSVLGLGMGSSLDC